jgi:hypothetical protein
MTDTATLSSKFRLSIPRADVLRVPVPEPEALRGLAAGASPTDHHDRSDRA